MSLFFCSCSSAGDAISPNGMIVTDLNLIWLALPAF
jgi:hypothetical protein